MVVHAANNAFGKWVEYNEMIGLGGWGGRNEDSGPYLFFDNSGKLIRDPRPGRGGKLSTVGYPTLIIMPFDLFSVSNCLEKKTKER